KLIKHFRISLHQSHQVLRFKKTKRSQVRSRFRETIQFVGAAVRRVEQHRLWMPGMTSKHAGSRMIPGDRQDVGSLAKEDRQRGVQFGNRIAFSREVPVLPLHIGIFEMDKEEIKVR